LVWNKNNWHRPSGPPKGKGFAENNGYGFEEWLFRSEWIIDSWRYSFLQGVNTSSKDLMGERKPVDIILFTIRPDKKRCYVAQIRSVERLNDRRSQEALVAFKQRGWYDTMKMEIQAVKGNDSVLVTPGNARNILNVRFRLENVRFYSPDTFARPNDPIKKYSRYQIHAVPKHSHLTSNTLRNSTSDSTDLPEVLSFHRCAILPLDYTPEHKRIQAKLMKELKSEYPSARISREDEFIDVKVQTEQEIILFEIKSDLEPKTVIRNALGQILEYAYYSGKQYQLFLSLVIVGRNPLSSKDEIYLNRLKCDFRLPIKYRVVTI